MKLKYPFSPFWHQIYLKEFLSNFDIMPFYHSITAEVPNLFRLVSYFEVFFTSNLKEALKEKRDKRLHLPQVRCSKCKCQFHVKAKATKKLNIYKEYFLDHCTNYLHCHGDRLVNYDQVFGHPCITVAPLP